MTFRQFFKAAASMKDVTARIPTYNDIPAMVALSKVTHRENYVTDYLPGWLPKILQDNNRIVVVLEKDSQMIGLGIAVGGLPNSEYITAEAGRILPDQRGKHLFGCLTYHMLIETNKRWPDWQVLLGGGTSTHVFDNIRDTIDIISERKIFRFPVRNDITPNPVGTQDSIQSLSTKDYMRMLSDTKITEKLYPRGLIAVEHLGYKAIPSSVDHIHQYHENIFASADEKGVVTAVSIGGSLPCDDDRAWRYNFNYDGQPDLQLYLSHLNRHLENTQKTELWRKTIHFILMMPSPLWKSLSESDLVQCLATRFNIEKSDITVLRQYLLEHLHLKALMLENKTQLPSSL